MIHLYCGDGKGKTTAAVGLTVRAAGRGRKIIFAQFMKSSSSGELNILKNIENVTVMRAAGNEKFTFQMNSEERRTAAADNQALFENVEKAAVQGVDMVVLDEAVTAVERGMLDEDKLKAFVSTFNETGDERELVLTGSVPELWMIEAADYVTDMEKIKHPFDKGTAAREGVEY